MPSTRCAATVLRFGMAYQLVDDWLDYAGDSQAMGKDAGDDLAEGKVTLPLIHTMVHGNRADAGTVRDAINRRSADDFRCGRRCCSTQRRTGLHEGVRRGGSGVGDGRIAGVTAESHIGTRWKRLRRSLFRAWRDEGAGLRVALHLYPDRNADEDVRAPPRVRRLRGVRTPAARCPMRK